MEIYLNGERLDFRLEGERTVADVAEALGRWLAAGSLCVDSVSVDSVDAPRSSWSSIALDRATRLDVGVASLAEARLQTLRAAHRFLLTLREAVSRRDRSLLGELSAGYPAMVEGVRTILCPLPGNELHEHLLALDRLLAGNTAERIALWPEETAASALLAMDDLLQAVSLALEEADRPLRALPRVRAALLDSLARIDRIPVLLQTGKDRDAMAGVVEVSSRAQGLLRAISARGSAQGRRDGGEGPPPFDVDGRPLDEFQRELNGVLRQLLDAFAARDTVLIGDLLEYEAAPRLRALAAAAQSLEGGADA